MTQFGNVITVQLTDEQKVAYGEQGFVVLPSVLGDAEIARQRDTFDRLFTPPADGGKPLYFDLTGKDPDAELDDCAVPQLLHPSHHVTDLPQSPAWQAALDIAAQLFNMGPHTPRDLVVRDHMIVKPPHTTGPTPWHQDEAYWQEDKLYQELSVWFALQKTTEKMGCMQFIAGSHRGEVRPHHPWKNDPKIIALEVDADCVDATLAVACPLHAGAATVHSARTLHYTSGNRTDEPRRALIFTVGTPPAQRDQPRNFYWNQKERDYKKECLDRGVRQ
ncbi:MAG: phytanoyl-CoA dioxygenase family protein [Phycisphaeraceae bacterium]|nr:phytanoyl-CoA dioxygenase family protein [Phycisphaeraceae bacterium]